MLAMDFLVHSTVSGPSYSRTAEMICSISLNFLIMESLPIYYVIPKYPNYNLLEYYDNIIYRNNRIPKLIELKAPEPIKIFEEKGFQNKINELINLLLSK